MGRRRVMGRIATASVLAIYLVLNLGSALGQSATLIPAFKGGVRHDAILKNPQVMIPISSACYTAIPANGKNAPDSAQQCILRRLKAMGASEQAVAFARYAPV